MEGLRKKGMAAAFCKDCDSCFFVVRSASGRPETEESRSLPVDGSQVGLHNTDSSPASPQ